MQKLDSARAEFFPSFSPLIVETVLKYMRSIALPSPVISCD